MPLYEYACSACGHRFEIIQKFSDPLLEACPKCGGAVVKLQSAPAFQFKGSGWYITDYARKDAGAPKPDGGGADGAGASASGADKTAAPAAEKDKKAQSGASGPPTASTPAKTE